MKINLLKSQNNEKEIGHCHAQLVGLKISAEELADQIPERRLMMLNRINEINQMLTVTGMAVHEPRVACSQIGIVRDRLKLLIDDPLWGGEKSTHPYKIDVASK